MAKDFISKDAERWIYHAESGREYNIAELVSPYECKDGVTYDSYVLLDCWVYGEDNPMKIIGFIYGINAIGLDDIDIMAWCRKSVNDYEKTLTSLEQKRFF